MGVQSYPWAEPTSEAATRTTGAVRATHDSVRLLWPGVLISREIWEEHVDGLVVDRGIGLVLGGGGAGDGRAGLGGGCFGRHAVERASDDARGGRLCAAA